MGHNVSRLEANLIRRCYQSLDLFLDYELLWIMEFGYFVFGFVLLLVWCIK